MKYIAFILLLLFASCESVRDSSSDKTINDAIRIDQIMANYLKSQFLEE